jgi:poly(A) polymerase
MQIYKGDSFHIMPIITPAYPSMCATHNITRSTKEIIQRELKRGITVMEKIMLGKAPWKELFMKHTFFTQGYKYYLSIISASTDQDAQRDWSGTVESKVRLLVQNLEGHESIAIAHPYIKGFERTHKCRTDEEVERAKSGSLEYQIKETGIATSADDHIDDAIMAHDTANGEQKANGDMKITMVYTTTFYVGLELQEGKCAYYILPIYYHTGSITIIKPEGFQHCHCCRPSTDINRCQITRSCLAGR